MASNINLGAARIATVAISQALGNKKKFQNLGTVQALRSPQNAAIIADMNPANAANEGRLSIIQGQTTPQARVQLNYRPQTTTTIKTSRAVTTGSNPVAATSLNVDYNTHKEYDLTYRTVDLMALEASAEKYLEQANSGNLSINIPNFQKFSDLGDQLLRVTDQVLSAVNQSLATSLVAGAGGNLLIGTVSPANLAVPNVTGFNATDGSINLALYDYIKNLALVHNFEGKPIVIGGLKAATWFGRKGIASVANLGYDYAKMYDLLDVEFYYDPYIDTASGADHMIIMDAGSAAYETIMEHQKVIMASQVGFTKFGTASVSVAQTNAPTFAIDMDIRTREDDSIAYPQYTISPSFHYGLFTRPAGFFKNYGGWDTVTGIFRIKIVSA